MVNIFLLVCITHALLIYTTIYFSTEFKTWIFLYHRNKCIFPQHFQKKVIEDGIRKIWNCNRVRALILHLADRSGDTLDVFATSLIQKELEDCRGTLFIKSTGKQPGKKYYSFDLVSR